MPSGPRLSVQRALSVPMGMGPGPKTFGIGFGLWTRPDHPALSLGSFVTVVTAILPLFSLRLLHLMGYRVILVVIFREIVRELPPKPP